ncbi:MAG: hypothetical protein A2Y77_17220 [Planctomycetes bacterium RBG_13_62_9]|nr:MAG: hypothetical protein A2Y77_17220 [Planctomycetes bacterium RBG_13_62_9]
MGVSMCFNRIKCGITSAAVPSARERVLGGTPAWAPVVLAVLLLVVAGVFYRTTASRVQGVIRSATRLPVPLKEFPLQVGDWTGVDLEIPSTTEDYMRRNFADDYISRRYVNVKSGLWADLYVVYCSSHPGGILGHRPQVCFPAHGWVDDGTVQSRVVSPSGRQIDCLLHRFHKPAPDYQEVGILSFYVLNGQITLSEREFSGPLGRRPNLEGDPARYVAQVQVSSIVEHSVRTAASQMADLILAFLPDQDGLVGATSLGYGPKQTENSESENERR